MRLFGFEIIIRRARPASLDTRQRLLAATAEVNTAWEEARKEKLWLSLWIDWQQKELLVTRLSHERVTVAEGSR